MKVLYAIFIAITTVLVIAAAVLVPLWYFGYLGGRGSISGSSGGGSNPTPSPTPTPTPTPTPSPTPGPTPTPARNQTGYLCSGVGNLQGYFNPSQQSFQLYFTSLPRACANVNVSTSITIDGAKVYEEVQTLSANQQSIVLPVHVMTPGVHNAYVLLQGVDSNFKSEVTISYTIE